MTAFGTAVGMLPIALERAIGLERLSPLAVVAIGGLMVWTPPDAPLCTDFLHHFRGYHELVKGNRRQAQVLHESNRTRSSGHA